MTLTNILVGIALVVNFTACAPNYSNGEWTGVVTKLSRKGIIWKSWEGQILMGGVRQKSNYTSKGEYAGTSSVANVMEFNVDPSIVDQVINVQNTGETVTLVYHQWLIGPPWIDGDHVVYEVRKSQ